jgi:hypothetical protein
MLSPLSLSGLSIGSEWFRPVRAVSPTPPQPGTSSAAGTQSLSPIPLVPPALGTQPDSGNNAQPPPRGSLLDLSV